MTEKLAQNDLGSLMMMRKHSMGGPYLGAGYNVIGSSGDFSPLVSSGVVNNENFGVQAVRQIVDAIRTMGESPAKLVEALAAARANDLPDVVAALERKLGITKEEPPSERNAPEGSAS